MEFFGPLDAEKADIKAPVKVFGPLHIRNSQVGAMLNVSGPITAESTVFKVPLVAQGPLECRDCQIEAMLDLSGPLMTSRGRFLDRVTVRGPIFAEDASFAKAVINHTGMARFKNSSVQGEYTVHHSGKQEKAPIVCLEGNSQLHGITFQGSKGRVYLADKGAKVAGRIVNGEALHAPCPQKP